MRQARNIKDMVELTVREARALLVEYADVLASRDERIRTAFESGIAKSQIARLARVSRGTVDRALSASDGSATAQKVGEPT